MSLIFKNMTCTHSRMNHKDLFRNRKVVLLVMRTKVSIEHTSKAARRDTMTAVKHVACDFLDPRTHS